MNKKILVIIVLLAMLAILWILIVGVSDSQFKRVQELINTTIWPFIALFGVLFFNKVFTYFFFSMKKFNFFGMEGKLKDVEKVISEEVERRLKEKEGKELSKEIAETVKKEGKKEEKIGGCSLENLSACDNVGLMQIISQLLSSENSNK